MKILSFSLLFLLIQMVNVSGNNPHFRTTGRVVWEGPACVMSFPGTVLETRFNGSQFISLDVELISGTSAWFNVWVNGIQMRPIEVDGERQILSLASKLDPDDTHHIRLVRRTEAWQGVVRIHGLVADDSVHWLPAPPLPTRRIMAIGDSITCGAAVEVREPYTRDGNHHSNAESSYGFILSKMLNAQIHLVSYGGKGLIRDWQGFDTEVTAPQFFERAHPDWPDSQWDHSQYVPDIVLVCLGQNDFNQGIIDEATYVPRYIEFCERILNLHPNARLLLCSSPMQGEEDPKRFALEAYLDEVASHFATNGKSPVRAFHNKCYDGTELNAHPTDQQQRQMAHDLYPVVGKWMGWLK